MLNKPNSQKIIVLVEDDKSINLWVTQFLTMKGHKVISCHNGLEGLRAIRIHKPDFVLLDYEMPLMNGMEVLINIKKEEFAKKIPFIMFSAKSDELTVRKSVNLGASGFIVKPFNPDDLSKRLATYL